VITKNSIHCANSLLPCLITLGLTRSTQRHTIPLYVCACALVKAVEDCRTRASRPPQTHCRYKAVDGPSSRYTAQSILSHPVSSITTPNTATSTTYQHAESWRRQRAPIAKASARASTSVVTSESNITTPATPVESSQITLVGDFAQSQIDAVFTTFERHFSHNINAAWLKLNDCYTRTDATLIYRAAVVLHPSLKWR
jgi:hypothetical protein